MPQIEAIQERARSTRLRALSYPDIRGMSLPPRTSPRISPRPSRSRDGGVLRTIGEAVTYMLALPPARGELCQRWRRATKPILEQADVAAVGHLEGIVSKRLGSRYRSGRSPDWLKFKNPEAPAVKREAEEDWGRP
jgi:hypothetical protein